MDRYGNAQPTVPRAFDQLIDDFFVAVNANAIKKGFDETRSHDFKVRITRMFPTRANRDRHMKRWNSCADQEIADIRNLHGAAKWLTKTVARSTLIEWKIVLMNAGLLDPFFTFTYLSLTPSGKNEDGGISMAES